MMKVVVVSSSFPYPVDIGRKVIISGFLEYFVSAFGGENVVFAYVATCDDRPSRTEIGCDALAFPLGGIARRLVGAAWEGAIRGRHALQEMMVFSRAAAVRLNKLLQVASPDLVVVDTVRMAQYLNDESRRATRSFLYLDDLYSLRYQRMLAAMRSHPDVAFDSIGSFGRFVPGLVRRMAGLPTIQQSLLRLESRILEKREQELPRDFDRVLLLNAEEAARLAGRTTGAANISTVKPLLRGHRGRLPRRFAGEPIYIFLGNLQYPANAYSLRLFLREAMPRLVQMEPKTRLLVIGRGADGELLKEAAAWGKHVQFLNFVENLAPVMSTAAAMIVPLIYGSGLKMKVLDALYYGVPLVSTRTGVDGVGVTPGRECFVEDDIAGFVEPLRRLLDVGQNCWMSECALDLYASQFSREVVWEQYQHIFCGADVSALPPRRREYAH